MNTWVLFLLVPSWKTSKPLILFSVMSDLEVNISVKCNALIFLFLQSLCAAVVVQVQFPLKERVGRDERLLTNQSPFCLVFLLQFWCLIDTVSIAALFLCRFTEYVVVLVLQASKTEEVTCLLENIVEYDVNWILWILQFEESQDARTN